MKPFDLEAAKRGEPILRLITGEWERCYFVGLDANGYPVIHTVIDTICRQPPDSLRMAPKTVTVRYRVALCQGPHDQYVMAVQEGDPEPQLRACGFIEWLGEWQTAEIQGDE
jgi:hypothetical protein